MSYWENHVCLVPPDKLEPNNRCAWERLEELEKKGSQELNKIDKQRMTVLRIELEPSCCPICDLPVCQIDAATAYRELYDAVEARDNDYACPCCGMHLIMVVPFVAPPLFRWQAALTDAQIDMLRETVK